MLQHPHGESPPVLQARLHQALDTLASLRVDEQLEVACQLVVGILKASQPHFGEAQGGRAAYDALCNAVEEWFQDEIDPLRFGRVP